MHKGLQSDSCVVDATFWLAPPGEPSPPAGPSWVSRTFPGAPGGWGEIHAFPSPRMTSPLSPKAKATPGVRAGRPLGCGQGGPQGSERKGPTAPELILQCPVLPRNLLKSKITSVRPGLLSRAGTEALRAGTTPWSAGGGGTTSSHPHGRPVGPAPQLRGSGCPQPRACSRCLRGPC